MNWIRITAKSQKDIRVGDFVRTIYFSNTLYKVLSIEYVDDEMYLMVGVSDKHGAVDERCIYARQHIKYFGTYSPQNRKAQVI